jgi:hypothetical protein
MRNNFWMQSTAMRVIGVAIALVVALLPWILAANGREPPQRAAHRKKLSDMNAAERRHLDENLEQFHKLSATEREQVRELHETIENDPELKQAFEEYVAWASRLSPSDRHELRNAQDAEARRNVIDRINRPPPETPSNIGRPPNGIPPFSSGIQARGDRMRLMEKLFGRSALLLIGERLPSSVPEMEAIVSVLESELPSDARKELQELDPISRKVRVIRLTLDRHPEGPLPERLFGSPGSPRFQRVMRSLPEGPLRLIAANRNPGAVTLVLFRGLMTEMQRGLEDHRPSPETLRRVQEKQSEPNRRRIEQLRSEDRQMEVLLLYLKESVPGVLELQQLVNSPEMERFFQESMSRMRFGPGGPDGSERPPQKGRPDKPDGPPRPRD